MCEPECSEPEPLICWPRLCTELNRAQPRISQHLIMRQCAIFVLGQRVYTRLSRRGEPL
jgi:hypothetical protein